MRIISSSSAEQKGIDSIEEVRRWRRALSPDETVGLVPTMGALHEGHRSLIRIARHQCQQVVLTIFVNPTQFAEGEDLDTYPRTLQQDLDVAREEGVDLVSIGDTQELYPEGFATQIELPSLAQRLCGMSRPQFFGGVCLIVLKLFHIFTPHRSYFGEKDYQQLTIIRRMVADLDLDLEVVPCPLIREADGLALSSRNVRLDDAARGKALSLSAALFRARDAWTAGEVSVEKLKNEASRWIADDVEVDYLEVVDRSDLSPLSTVSAASGAVMCMAATVDGVRLIDNIQLESR